MALPKMMADLTVARLADVTVPDGAAWGNVARAEALSRVRQMGLPTKRDEYWKYTDPSSLTAPTAPEAARFENDEGALFADMDRVKIVFVDGVFDPEASDDLIGENLQIDRLADEIAADINCGKELYGVLEARGQTPVERPLAALNTALATDGVVIRVMGKAEKPINFIFLHSALHE